MNINYKALSEEMSSGVSGEDRRTAETQQKLKLIIKCKGLLRSIFTVSYNVNSFMCFGLSVRNHSVSL